MAGVGPGSSPAPSLRPGSSNPWAGRGTARARAGELGRASRPPPPLPRRVPPAGRAGEVVPRPGRPWGLTVGKVWPEEEVASRPGRWRPGLDRGARGLRAGSRRGRAPAPGLEPIPGTSGAGLGRERSGGRGKQLRSWERGTAPAPGRPPPPRPQPWHPERRSGSPGHAAPSGRRQWGAWTPGAAPPPHWIDDGSSGTLPAPPDGSGCCPPPSSSSSWVRNRNETTHPAPRP